jgi:hypothetical protein
MNDVKIITDESRWIENNQDRCGKCGHLEIFHNTHCCFFCMVDGCECETQ